MTIKVTYNVTDVYVTQDVSPVYINVSYSGGGSGGAAVWGGITGTLSNQTDLQNALNAKFDDPTGTTSQYLRGDGSLATFPAIPSGTVTSVGLTMPSAFSVANSPITSSGTLAVTATGDTTQYIAGDGSLVAFPITGQAGTLVREVRNVTGATLTKGTVVYINGASGNKPTVAKALATGDATSAQTFGLIQADIPNNSNGYLVAFGDLDGLNTSAFAEGVQLYLSATTAGEYTSTKQYAPNHLVYVGVVTRQHVNQGRIEVRIQNGYEMDELHDVAAQTPSNNDGLFYNTTNSLWENKSIATALGYTPANAATTLTINGVTFDLSTSRTFTVGSVTGSGASGQVAYWDGTTSQAGSNNLFWDAANGRLGIGTNAPTDLLSLKGSSTFSSIALETTGYPTKSYIGNFQGRFYQFGSNRRIDGFISNASAAVAYVNVFADNGIAHVTLSANNTNNADARDILRVWGSGNVSIQNGGTFTDGGQRLQVQGTTLLNGNVTFSSSTGMTWDATNSRLGIGTNAPAYLLEVLKNQNTQTSIAVTNTTIGTVASTAVKVFADNGRIDLLKNSSARTPYKILGANDGAIYNYSVTGNSDIAILNEDVTGNIKFGAGSASTAQMTLHNTGNLLLGSTTNSGERLQVTGDTLLKGSGATSGTTALRVQNSSSQNILRVRNDGNILIGNDSQNVWMFPYTTYDNVDFAGKNLAIYPLQGSISIGGGSQIQTSGNQNNLITKGRFQPSSGTATFTEIRSEPLINQTGGANGITRGLYVNPTLTSAADFRAIETTNGKVIFGNLPTSSAGLPTGAIWNDAGTIKIV
jgi:hypothetical protein